MTDLTTAPAAEGHPAIATAPSGPAVAPQAPVADAPAIPIAKTAPAPTAPVSDAKWPSITHTLLHPLPVEGKEPLSEIVVREPDLETLEAVLGVVEAHGLTDNEAKLGLKVLRPLLSALTGIPDASLKRLHFKDATALMEKMAPLLEGLTS